MSPEAAPMPEIRSRRLRRQLFIVELERLLEDPAGFPLGDNFDSLRVRIDKAVDRIEDRAAALAGEAADRARMRRAATAISAFLGTAAILAALALPQYRVPALLVAAGEVVAVLGFARAQRAAAADSAELERLRARYRPALEDCADAAALRALAKRIGAEMAALAISPIPEARELEGGRGRERKEE